MGINGNKSVTGLNYIIKKAIENVDIVCLSSNTTNWSMTRFAISIIYEIKPSIRTILGGLHPTYFHEYIIKSTPAEFIIKGEGEKTLPLLINAIKRNKGFESIPGLTWKQGEKVIVNNNTDLLLNNEFCDLPLPAYDLMPIGVYRALPVETSRGCKFGCTFCSIPRKNNWVGFETEWTINRINTIISKYGNRFLSSEVFITDDCFTADTSRSQQIIDSITNKHKQIKLSIETRVTDYYKKSKETLIGIYGKKQISRLASGIECGYDEGLRRIKKGLTINQIDICLNKLADYDLIKRAYYTFIIGFPWETIDECLKTIDYAALIVKRYGYLNVNVNWLRLYPSQIWYERNNFGIYINEDSFDEHLYHTSIEYFCKTHPNIDESTMNYINKLIDRYSDIGVYIQNA